MNWAFSSASRVPRQPKYSTSLTPSSVPGPINHEIFCALRKLFAGSGQAEDAVLMDIARTLAAKLSLNTWRSYQSSFARFVKFCVERDLDFLPASVSTGLLWAQHLSSSGTVQAKTAQPYFSSVNSIHELVGLPKPCVGPQLAAFRKGWQRLQSRLDTPSVLNLAFPASLALAIYNVLPSLASDLPALRAALFLVLNFSLVLRTDSLLSVKRWQVASTESGPVLRYQPIRWKGKILREDEAPTLQFPLANLPYVAAAIDSLPRGRGSVWQLVGEASAPSVSNAEGWFAATLTTFAPSAVRSHTLYSLRRGGASAARAVGVPLEVLESFGGWCVGSSILRSQYLDYGVARDAASVQFFGALASSGLPLFVGQFFNG